MKYSSAAYLLLLVLATSLVVSYVASAQAWKEEPSWVIRLDLSRTTVYRGYQWVEVVAYIHTGLTVDDTIPRPTVTVSRVTLSAGIEITLPLTLVTLISPTTVVVGDKTYTVQYLVIGRVTVPESAYTGKGTLRVEVSGRAAGRDFSFTRTITLEIADHRPVLAAKTETYAAIERVRAVVSLASALGVDVTGFVKELRGLEEEYSLATERLELYGEVEEALRLYIAEGLWREVTGYVIGSLNVLYNHEVEGADARLTDVQHEYADVVVSALHVHLDPGTCLLVIAVRGSSERVRELVKNLERISGVLLVRPIVVLATPREAGVEVEKGRMP